MAISFEDVKNNESIKCYISEADKSLIALGYTEHSFAHVGKVAVEAEKILRTEISAVMDYFEIFLGRMLLSRKAAEFLRIKFELIINQQRLL